MGQTYRVNWAKFGIGDRARIGPDGDRIPGATEALDVKLWYLARQSAAPVLALLVPLPRISTPDPDTAAAFADAMDQRDGIARFSRDHRNEVAAADAAVLLDILQRPAFTVPANVDDPIRFNESVPTSVLDDPAYTVRAAVAPTRALAFEPSTRSWRPPRTVRNYYDQGRDELRKLGVWPWAVLEENERWPKRWQQHRAFWDALDAWYLRA
jgi:hypothetical protein